VHNPFAALHFAFPSTLSSLNFTHLKYVFFALHFSFGEKGFQRNYYKTMEKPELKNMFDDLDVFDELSKADPPRLLKVGDDVAITAGPHLGSWHGVVESVTYFDKPIYEIPRFLRSAPQEGNLHLALGETIIRFERGENKGKRLTMRLYTNLRPCGIVDTHPDSTAWIEDTDDAYWRVYCVMPDSIRELLGLPKKVD